MAEHVVTINRAPVLTLWAAVVAEQLGFQREEALSLGKAVSGLTAQVKGRMLGIFTPNPQSVRKARERKRGDEFWVKLCGRSVPTINTAEGVRAVIKGEPIEPEGVAGYLESKFGAALHAARQAMSALAESLDPDELADKAFHLYERFRPEIPEGVSGWGAKGELDLDRIRALASKGR